MAAAADAPAIPRAQKFNIGQYRGLLDTVSHIRDKVDKERDESALREKGLKEQLHDKIKKGDQIQKELSVQLRCAGRSYSQILDANRELSEQIRMEIDVREDKIAALEKMIKDRDKIIRNADKPWKEELAKRELKLVKLQENNTDLKRLVKEEAAKIQPIHDRYLQIISEKEATTESVLVEVAGLNEQIEAMTEAHATQLREQKEPLVEEIKELKKAYREVNEVFEDKEAALKRDIKKAELKNVGLQKQLEAIDYTPYEKKIDALSDGFGRLVKDFEIKTQLNTENRDKMREGFEDVISALDRKIQDNEREYERRLAPYQEELDKKDVKIGILENRCQELIDAEAEVRGKEADVQADLRKELGVAKEAVDMYLKEMIKSKRAYEEAMEKMNDDNGPLQRMRAMERKLDQVTKQCADMIKVKDMDLKDKNLIVQRLQKKLADDALRFQQFADMWDVRVQEKERGYNKAIAELAFAEGQIVEERKRTKIEKEKVAARERDIARLKEEHTEELRIRELVREELEEYANDLEAKLDVEASKMDPVRAKLEVQLDALRRRMDERVSDLRVEMNRRDIAKEEVEVKLSELQMQWVEARNAWDDKERELEVFIRTRDRNILALKNELEFLNDSWEIKYQRLVNLFEKCQKKYEEAVGPNGVQEAFRRAMALKAENEKLHTTIHELREVIQKQKKVIRGLQLDIDQLMKETADVILEKERGIAEMAGDYVKLENKYRDEQTLRARLLKQKDAERLALAESFQARIEQLEQIMEAMRFNDRDELIEKINKWKKNYERVCTERDDVEDHYKDLVERKETQLQGMIVENDQEREKTKGAHKLGEEKVEKTATHYKKIEIEMKGKHEELEDHNRQLQIDLAHARWQHDRQLAIAEGQPKEDPAIAPLKAKIEELHGFIKELEAGKNGLLAEIERLENREEAEVVEVEDNSDKYERMLAKKDKEMKIMEMRHDELKEILKMEMKRAQDTCRDIEEQVKRFPEPFEFEIQEMKEKYAQMQAGMAKIQVENMELRKENEKTRRHFEKEISSLEKNLNLAKTLLHEVSNLEALKHLRNSDARRAYEDLGLSM